MRHSKALIVLASIVGIVFLAVHQGESKAKKPTGPFGQQVAGTWFGEYVVYLPDPADPILAINAVHADGTGIAVSPELHGNGDPGLLGLRSPFYYTWEQTGRRSLAFSGLYFAFDETGALGVPALANGAIVRLSGQSDYERDMQSFTGSASVDIFTKDQDPLDPEVVPVLSFPMTYEYHRLHVQ